MRPSRRESQVGRGDSHLRYLGWNASEAGPAEDIEVKWEVTNTGQDELLNCVDSESNSQLDQDTNLGNISTGVIVTGVDDYTCSESLDEEEPDTATVTCDCETDQPGDPSTPRKAMSEPDGANFNCQTPMLNISKECVPSNNTTGDPTVDFEIVGADGKPPIKAATRAECEPPPPLSECLLAEKNSLTIKDDGKSKWKWSKGAATTKADFGDPTTDTDYRVCLYDGVEGVQNPPICTDVPAGTAWSEQKKGFKFKGGSATGITSIKLKEGEAGKAKIQVKGEDTDAGEAPPLRTPAQRRPRRLPGASPECPGPARVRLLIRCGSPARSRRRSPPESRTPR